MSQNNINDDVLDLLGIGNDDQREAAPDSPPSGLGQGPASHEQPAQDDQEQESEVVRENRKKFAREMLLMDEFAAKMEIVFQVKIKKGFRLPFQTITTELDEDGELVTRHDDKNDKVPGIYLTKSLTGVEIRESFEGAAGNDNDAPPPAPAKSVVAHYGYLSITCSRVESADQEGNGLFRLSAEGIQRHEDLSGNALRDAREAVMEAARTAALLIKQAKAMGIRTINFGETSDPIYRACLALACKSEGLAYDEAAEGTLEEIVQMLPQIPVFREKNLTTVSEVSACMSEALINPYVEADMAPQPRPQAM